MDTQLNHIVLGSQGFLGNAICQKLTKENQLYGAFDIKNSPDEDILEDGFWDKLNNGIKYDVLWHFAAPSSIIDFKHDEKKAMFETIEGFRKACEWCIKNDVILVYPSTGSLFGEKSNIYAETKRFLENLAKEYYGRRGLRYIMFNVFAVFGIGEEHKGEKASVIYQWLRAIIDNKPIEVWGDGTQRRNFIYIDKAIEKMWEEFCKYKKSGEDSLVNVLISSSASPSFNKILYTISKELNLNEVKLKYIPITNDYINEIKIPSEDIWDLGYIPRNVIEGIKQTYQHLKAQKEAKVTFTSSNYKTDFVN